MFTPSLSALKINVRLFVTTSNFSSPTLVTLVMKEVEMIPLEYTSYNTAHTQLLHAVSNWESTQKAGKLNQ